MNDDVTEIRAALAAFPRKYRSQKYPGELRRRVVAFARMRQGSGMSTRAIARELGMRFETLRRWLGEAEPKSASALLPVRVTAPAVRSRSVTVVTPDGWRIEGLDAHDALALLRR